MPFIFIWGLGILVYFKSLSFGFTYLDDNALILNNYKLLSDPANFFRLFRLGHFIAYTDAYYRPLVDISYMLDTILRNTIFASKQYFIYHLTNIIIHLFAASLLYLFLIKLELEKHLAFYFSLAFAVHPALTQAVSWIPGRNDSLLGVFVFLSFIFFINFSKEARAKDYLGHIFFFCLALFTKEIALVLPFLCLFFKPLSKKNILLVCIGYGSAMAIWFILRQAALPNPPLGMMTPVMFRELFKNLPALIQYTGKALLPFNLSVMPLIQDTPFIWGIAVIVSLGAGIFLSKSARPRLVLFGAFWFLLFLLPAFLIPYPSNVTHFYEHRLYLPLVGLIIILCEIVVGLNLNQKILFVSACLVIAIFSYMSYNHSLVFKDKMSFWQSAVNTSPHSPLAHRNLGAMYYLDGKLKEAEEEFREALRINPYEPMANNNLGLIFMQKGELGRAKAAFLRELSFNPNYDDTNFNLGLLYYKLGKKEEASRLWEKTLKINPSHKQAFECLNEIWRGGDKKWPR